MKPRRCPDFASSLFALLAGAGAFVTAIPSAQAQEAPTAPVLKAPALPEPPIARAPLPSPAVAPPPTAAAPPVADGADAALAAIPASTQSMRITYEATRVDRPGSSGVIGRSPDDYTLLHGFRIGYGYIMNYDQKSQAFGGESIKDKLGLRSPSQFLLGYEVVYRVVSHSWLNVILLGNAEVSGLEQSKFLPSANLLIGAELNNTFQIGVGANLTPLAGSEAHAIVAAGWTPRIGTIYTPVHFFFVPDVDGNHRMGVTTGVTF